MVKSFILVHTKIDERDDVIKRLMPLKFVERVTGVYGIYDIIVEIESDIESRLEKLITIKSCKGVINILTLNSEI